MLSTAAQIDGGSTRAKMAVFVHPFPSVAVTVYEPPHSEEADAVLAPELHT